MVVARLKRRAVLAAVASAALVPHLGRASEYIDLNWQDLLPEHSAPQIPDAFSDVMINHGASLPSQQPQSSGVRTEWNGQIVRMPGYILPLEFKGEKVITFILVPFVGACIHVPPPPANQLIYVTTQDPFKSAGLFEPVYVTGQFGTASTATPLAQIGYEMTAHQIELYKV